MHKDLYFLCTGWSRDKANWTGILCTNTEDDAIKAAYMALNDDAVASMFITSTKDLIGFNLERNQGTISFEVEIGGVRVNYNWCLLHARRTPIDTMQ